jgi:hypothetical protein
LRERRARALDLGYVGNVHRAWGYSNRRRHGLDFGKLADPGAAVME